MTIITADGEEQGDRLLREALEHVDEPTYLNIFAVGLREVQELNSLSDTAAAQWLYRLTSGLDRISLYDVIHMLEGTRLRLLNSAEEQSEIRSLLVAARAAARRAGRAGRQGPPLGPVGREAPRAGRRSRSPAGRGQSDSPPAPGGWKSRSTSSRCGSSAARSTTSSNASPTFVRSKKARSTSLDDFNKRIEEHERQRDILKGQRQQLRDEAKRLGINDVLVRNGQRLEALARTAGLAASRRATCRRAGRRSETARSPAGERKRAAQPRVDRRRQDSAADHERHRRATHAAARAIEATEQMVAAAKHELEHPPHGRAANSARRSNRR